MTRRHALHSLLLSAAATASGMEADSLPAPLPDADHAAGKIRLASYNILGGRNPDGKRDLSRVATVLKLLNPDIVALQEVDTGTRRIQGRNVPAELEKLTGWKSYFAEAMPFDGGSYGEAVLTRLKVTHTAPHLLPARKGSEPRAALELQCLLAEGRPFTFIATHLDHQDNEADRLLQVRKLLELFTARTLKSPAVLAGDLNAPLDSPALKELTAFWQPTTPPDAAPPTFPATGPKDRIDHLLLQPNAGWKVLRNATGTDIFPGNSAWKAALLAASDHVPILAEVELTKEPLPEHQRPKP